MKLLHFHALAATSLLLPATGPAFAQQGSPASAAKPAPPSAQTTLVADPAVEKRFDIELNGASAGEAVTVLAEKVGHPINVIFTGDSAGALLPALQLRKVTLSEFFAAVKAAGIAEQNGGRPGYEFAAVNGAPNIYTFSVTQAPSHDFRLATSGLATGPRTVATAGFAPAAILTGGVATPVPSPQVAVNPSNRATVSPPPGVQWTTGSPGLKMTTPRASEKSTIFFDLSKILDKSLTIEDVTTAIRTGWTAASDGKEPAAEALKFHQESKLLIATGPPERLEAVEAIIKLLEDRKRPSKDEQEHALVEMRLRFEEAAQRNTRLEAKIDDMEKQRDAAVRDLRDQIAKLEFELAKRGKTP